MECIFGLLCSASIIDQELNNLSLYNVIDQLNIEKKLFKKAKSDETELQILLQHEIVTVWRTKLNPELYEFPMSMQLKVKLIDPTAKILNESLITMVIDKPNRRFKFRIRFNGIKITTPGDYIYRIESLNPDSSNFELEKEIPLEVIEKTSK